MCDGDLAFAVLDSRRLQAIAPGTVDDALADLVQTLPCREVGGHMIRRPWDLVRRPSALVERRGGDVVGERRESAGGVQAEVDLPPPAPADPGPEPALAVVLGALGHAPQPPPLPLRSRLIHESTIVLQLMGAVR